MNPEVITRETPTTPTWRVIATRYCLKGLGYLLFHALRATRLPRITRLARRPSTQKTIFLLMRFLLNKKNRYIDSNLNSVFSDLSDAQRKTIRQQFCSNLLITAAESVTMDGSHFDQTVFVGTDHLSDHDNGILFVSCHLNNWEMCRQNLSYLGYPAWELYRDFSQTLFDYRIYNKEHRFDLQDRFLPTSDTSMFVEKLEQGKHGYLFIDIKVKQGRNGVLLDFCDQPAWTSTFAADIALKTNKTIIPVYLQRLPEGHYRQTFAPPLDTTSGDPKQITQQLNAILSSQIMANPASWALWDTNRWG